MAVAICVYFTGKQKRIENDTGRTVESGFGAQLLVIGSASQKETIGYHGNIQDFSSGSNSRRRRKITRAENLYNSFNNDCFQVDRNTWLFLTDGDSSTDDIGFSLSLDYCVFFS